jgi:uncharacterized RDD family membrane protein YckC
MTNVVTGEAVALELPVANFPSRIAALLLDMIVQIAALAILFIVLGLASRSLSGGYIAAEFLTAYVLVLVGYPTTFETLSRGKTLGKMALGLRVVGDDGSPVRFRQALVRALVGVFEIWTFVLAPVGLITSIISARGKRVGDFFAGTYVIQERVPARRALPPVFAAIPPPLAAWAEVLQVARLSDQTAEAAGSYLRRFAELSPQARDALGIQLANAVAAEVSPLPPAGTPPAAYLSAVLAVRRAREWASFAPVPNAPHGQVPPAPARAQPQATATAEPARTAEGQPATATEPVVAQPAPAHQPTAAGEPIAVQPAQGEPTAAAESEPAPAERRLAPPA